MTSKRTDALRQSMLLDLARSKALLLAGFDRTYWTTRYIKVAQLHNQLFRGPKQKVSILP